jgi:ribosome maturation factor RimP
VGEEVVMRGDSRHGPSRPRQDSRGGGGTGVDRVRRDTTTIEPDELARLLEPVVTEAGLDLEAVKVTPAGRRKLVRLVVDADGGVGLDDIAEISREVADRLDASGAMGEVPYTLEVSSPGVDRPLTEPRHWRRAVGRLVSVPLTATSTDSPAGTAAPQRAPTIRGRVLIAGQTTVTLDVDGDHAEFDYAELGPGRVQLEFGGSAGGH